MKIRLPYFELRVIVPYLKIRTAMNYERFDAEVREWVAVEIELWKWRFHFRVLTSYEWRTRGGK